LKCLSICSKWRLSKKGGLVADDWLRPIPFGWSKCDIRFVVLGQKNLKMRIAFRPGVCHSSPFIGRQRVRVLAYIHENEPQAWADYWPSNVQGTIHAHGWKSHVFYAGVLSSVWNGNKLGKRKIGNNSRIGTYTSQSHCGEQKVALLALPNRGNEDFGRPNQHFRVHFRSTFHGCEYLICATNRWKVLRKHILKCWFGLPKSSFGAAVCHSSPILTNLPFHDVPKMVNHDLWLK